MAGVYGYPCLQVNAGIQRPAVNHDQLYASRLQASLKII